MRRGWAAALGAIAIAIAGCGGGGGTKTPTDTSGGGDTSGDGGGAGGGGDGGGSGGGGGGGGDVAPAVKPPVVVGSFRFWGAEQGLSARISDVSADEAGNVYVAAGDAVFAKTRDAQDFTRFDADAAGLTKNCHDPSQISNPSPTDPAVMCPVISVAGSTPNNAIIGFQGVGTDGDTDADWAVDSGGADVVTFDGKALARERHVRIATPPGYVCEFFVEGTNDTECYTFWDPFYNFGRRKLRQVQRIVVNHDKGRALSYGDALLGGTHASISILVANPEARGLEDLTKGDPAWADAKDVFEHEHPAIFAHGKFLTGEAWALAFDPTTNVPWYANQIRMASLPGYATMRRPELSSHFHGPWWGNQDPPNPHLWIWSEDADPADLAKRDGVQSIAFCDDGTMWVGSESHGLAFRRKGASTFTTLGVPSGAGGALAVACDPLDGSVWVGFAWGGFGRYKGGAWVTDIAPDDLPAFARGPVRSIQIDRWATRRIVYLAHLESRLGPGAVTAYDGP